MRLGLAILALLLPAGATTITEAHVVGPDGRLARGRLTITAAPAFSTPDGKRVEAPAIVTILNGRFTLSLVANDGSTPASRYRAAWAIEGAAPRTELWYVPSTNAVLGVKDVATIPPVTIPPVSTEFVDAEAPGGTMDGANRTFTLAHAPSPALSLELIRNGIVLQAGPDYTLTGAQVVYAVKQTPQATDLVAAWYRWASTSAVVWVEAEVPSGTADGANRTFGLAHAPSPGASLLLARNGLVQEQGLDYTLSGSTITFAAAEAPGPGDTLVSWYKYGVAQ